MTYVRMIEDSHGDLVDIEHYCSQICWADAGFSDPDAHRCPCPEQADYAQHCPQCGDVSVEAIDHAGIAEDLAHARKLRAAYLGRS